MPEEVEGEGGFGALVGEESSAFEEGGALAWDSDDFDASMLDLRSSCGEGVGADSSAGIDNVLSSSSVSASTAIRVPTFTPFDPASCCHHKSLSI